MDAHVFIDNSNIYGGAQRASYRHEPEAVWLAVRIYYRNFFRLIEGNDHPITRVLGGSVPPGNEALWKYAREAGYNTDLLKKIEKDDGKIGEQGVDEILHLKIANVLLDYDPPQKLIICTGDGNDSDFETSFTKQIERALKRGWDVVVWSWKDQLSGKFRLKEDGVGTGTLDIRELDPYYFSITFVQEGDYEVNETKIKVSGRVVHNLP